MEIVFTVKTTGNNYHQQFKACTNNKLDATVAYNSSELMLVNIKDAKTNFDGIKLSIGLENSEQNNTADFICTSSSVECDLGLTEKSESQFETIVLAVQIENYEAEITELKAKEDNLNRHIEELKIDIQELEKKLEYQDYDEQKSTYAAIEAKNIEIRKMNKDISKNQSEQESYKSKIAKCKEKISEIEAK